jgi:site-specific DNA recombinase
MYTIEEITKKINDLGLINRQGNPLSRSQYHRLLRNPLYYGILDYGGEFYEGKHKPIISKTLFDAVQEAAKQKRKPQTPTLKPYIYRGLFRCGECGCFITTETQKGHNYLHCTKRVKKNCGQPYVREEIITRQIIQQLHRMSLTPEWADWMISELEAEQKQGDHSRQETYRTISAQIQETANRINRLTDAFLEKAFTLEEYREIKKQTG